MAPCLVRWSALNQLPCTGTAGCQWATALLNAYPFRSIHVPRLVRRGSQARQTSKPTTTLTNARALLPAPRWALVPFASNAWDSPWPRWVLAMLEQTVIAQEARRQRWLAYRAFIDSIDWDAPAPLLPLHEARFDQYGGMLDDHGRLKVQGLETTEFTKMRRTIKKSMRINTNSLIVGLRPWQPAEIHYYRRTAVPITTWRVGIFLPRGQINLPNAKITRISYLVRQAVRETFPGKAVRRHDYMIIARPHIIDVSYGTLLQDLTQVALESQRLHRPARTTTPSSPPPTKRQLRKNPKSHA